MTIPPLLMLTEGRRPRPRKAPPIRPREVKLHTDVAKVLRDHCLPEWLWVAYPERRTSRCSNRLLRLKRMGVKPGVPDILLVSPHGSVRFLELKRIGESLKPTCKRIFELIAFAKVFRSSSHILSMKHLSRSMRGAALRIKIGGGR